MKRRYRLTIAYDGTKFSGWQIQPNAKTIQEELQKALSTILRTPLSIVGSGRTDQGVHAKGQVAHFEVDHGLDHERVLLSLNGLLPTQIRVKALDIVDKDFHACYSAKTKIYHYHLWLESVVDPILYRYRLHMRKPLDLKLIQKAARKFVGLKDFTSFANLRGPGVFYKNAVRNLKRLDLVFEEGGVRLEFEGEGFLYKMVRNITGVLLEVGQKRRSILSIDELFEARNRQAIGMPAPAHALFLYKVNY
ncbi:MAG: tRNA pseudouridine synthase A [Chlamydiae bacterium]|nr:tRNA pseudouridine synthase A [Chlamydiota bacterium]